MYKSEYVFLFHPKPEYPTFNKQQILYSSKLKEVADDNFKFNETGRQLSNTRAMMALESLT